MLRDGSDKISVLKVFNKFNHTVAEFHIQGLSQPSQLERVFQKFLVSFLYFPPSFPARLTTLGDSKSCANVFQQSLKGIFGTLIRDVISSGQQLIIFCHKFDGMLCSPAEAAQRFLVSWKEPKKQRALIINGLL